jgi:maltooligosyltrehalose trehalohydrolase
MPYQDTAVGAIPLENGMYRFTVWAPLHNRVDLLINHQTVSMTRDDLGYWTVDVSEGRHGIEYYYLLDGEKKLPDPASRWQPQGVHGPSAIFAEKFTWSDQRWTGLTLGEMVIYEIHTGTFTPPGTFEGIVSRLDYLNDLGINALELMPVAQFPGTRNWGYDGVYPFAVQNSYGGINGLKALVNECHRRGIAVILDVVYNHLGPEGNYLADYGPYFTEKYKTNWGQSLNFDDAWSDGPRNYFWQNAIMFLEEFHIDGLRLDAVHSIWDSGANHFIEELSRRVKSLESTTGRKKLLIAEFDLNNPIYISSTDKGGFGLDGQWLDEFHHAIHAAITGETDGYYEDFGTTEHITRSLADSYVYTGQYSKHRKKYFGKKPSNSYDQFVAFIQNHDQVGNRLLGDRLARTLSFESLKLAASALLLSPHVPMLFMGEEYGEKAPFQYFISHSDKQLIEAVRQGRKKEFSYFNWKGDVPDPQSEAVFEECKLKFQPDDEGTALLALYKFLIRFRKEREAMKNFDRSSLKIIDTNEGGMIAFERHGTYDHLLVVLNFSDETKTPRFVPGRLKRIFDSSSNDWAGDAADRLTNSGEVRGRSAVVFEVL